ncbi:Structural maintenance of chromosomes protein 1 [Astathelohania contejeani]|uniref:Structural maintenance of chromosomes protein 1 n=1 Tax=Astathelohania contejeani TaxID=164912 RepID=A0ABQ7HYT0_9MICR|nr:Structural maintenance of chromosomes protein 1 [Thelohania contejeani]
MALIKLEIENFKSYYSKHTIGPFDKFTCIVGPNGSGKSNLMDAFCFVLGITSNHLRADRLTDLINRNAEGKGAYVLMYFESGEKIYQLKRKILPTGQSQFLVDDQSVSSKEYISFLETQNIIVKIKNFLVFQGDVESIAIKPPKDLAKMVEQMSGSIELKPEYDELNKQREMLIRQCAEALEQKKEINAQIKEIKDEEEQQKKLKNLFERKEEINTKLYLHELFMSKEKLRKIESEIERKKEQICIIESNIKEKMNDIEDMRVCVAHCQKVYIEQENLVDSRENQIKMLNYRLIEEARTQLHKGEKMAELKREKEKLELLIKEKADEIKKYKNEIKICELGYKNSRRKKAELLKLKPKFEEQEDKFMSETAELRERVNSIEIEIGPKTSKIKSIEKRISEIQIQIEGYKSKIKDKNIRLKELKARLESTITNKTELEIKAEKEIKLLNNLKEDEISKNNELNIIMRKILLNRIKEKENETSLHIKNTVNTLKELFSGVYGCLVDLIKPTQKKYEIPLSVLLSKNDLAVIVEDEQTAIACLEYIKERKLCHMTFIPLNNLKEKNNNLIRDIKDARPAIDTIEFNPRFKKVIDYIFSTSLIVDNIITAKNIIYALKKEVKCVTLCGVLFHKNGLITGGGYKKSKFEGEELIKRRNEILEILKEIHSKKIQLSHIEIIQNKIDILNENIENIKKEEEEEIKQIKLIREELVVMVNQINEFKDIEISLKKELSVKTEEKDTLVSKIKRIEREMFNGVFEGDLEDFKKQIGESEVMKFEYENLINLYEMKIQNIERELQRLIERSKNFNVLEEKENLIDENVLKKEQERLKEDLKILNEKKEEYEKKKKILNLLNEEVKAIIKEKEVLSKELLVLETQKSRNEDAIEEIYKTALIEEIHLPLIKGKLAEYKKGIEIDFTGIEREDIASLKREHEDIIRAIDEFIPLVKHTTKKHDESKYIECNSRYENLKLKCIKAKEKFEAIKKERLERFMKCFRSVSQNIGEIYKKLTRQDSSEGNAYLILENENEPWEEGIKLHVMPPKKRFREMHLLSGGERTMAALSLIFSFHEFRPAPFYIFDEMDAALDKNNVMRVVDFILETNSQFIVISLKPTLFQHSESLVGVYKKEEESKVLTYRLN